MAFLEIKNLKKQFGATRVLHGIDFSMEKGEVRGPVKTQFGYHLIKLNEKNESKVYELAEIKDQLVELVNKDKQQNAYKSKINQLKILFPVDMM